MQSFHACAFLELKESQKELFLLPPKPSRGNVGIQSLFKDPSLSFFLVSETNICLPPTLCFTTAQMLNSSKLPSIQHCLKYRAINVLCLQCQGKE